MTICQLPALFSQESVSQLLQGAVLCRIFVDLETHCHALSPVFFERIRARLTIKELPLYGWRFSICTAAVKFLRLLAGGLFAGLDSFAGAYFSARATFDASVGIDAVDVAFRDCVNGANGLAGATSHARVSDYVSHDKIKFELLDN